MSVFCRYTNKGTFGLLTVAEPVSNVANSFSIQFCNSDVEPQPVLTVGLMGEVDDNQHSSIQVTMNNDGRQVVPCSLPPTNDETVTMF